MSANTPDEEARDTYVHPSFDPEKLNCIAKDQKQSSDQTHSYYLVIQDSYGREPHTEKLMIGENLIGRSEDCTIQLLAKDVSRVDCTVIVSNELVTIRDENSTNGTFINGLRIQEEMPLTVDQSITIGSVDMHLCQHN